MKRLLPLLLLASLVSAEEKQQPRTVSLDVKDAEARVVLRSMQKQCGIKNLVIDPDVQGSGTFYFRDVPCAKAFRIVLRTMGLAGTIEGDVISVERQQ